MKENLERILREQLENYEMPYENGAWEQFSKRLDGTPSTRFYRKWWFAAAVGTVLVGSATYFSLSSKEPASSAAPVAKKITTETTVQDKKTAPGTHIADAAVSATMTTQPADPQTIAEPEHVRETLPAAAGSESSPIVKITPPANANQPGNTAGNGHESHTNTTSHTPQYIKFEVPSMLCLNEPFTVKNPNETAITVTLPNGSTKTVGGKQTADFKANEAGRILVQSGSQSETITVNEATSNLIIDDEALVYEKGVPTLKFTALNADQGVTWDSNVTSAARSANKNELTVHPFTEKTVTVTAISNDQNGCTVIEKKTITLDRTYQLIAMTGFEPSSPDPRNSRFMPMALVLRDTPFELMITDPKSMTTIFRTTETQGWDGVDSRTGQIVPSGSTFWWKVVLKNPLPGEPTEYNGYITVKSNQ